MDDRRIDLAFLLVWPVIAAVVALRISATMLEGIGLFLVVPSLLLAFRASSMAKNVAVFAAFISTPVVIVIDSIAQATGTWYIPTSFPWRLYGLITVEAFLWGFFTAFLVVMVYRRFLAPDEETTVWSERKQLIAKTVYLPTLAYAIVFWFLPHEFTVPYFYLAFGFVLIIAPLTYAFRQDAEVWSRLVPIIAYFFYGFTVYELTALRVGFWGFPADGTTFLGWVTLLGERFPLEEFVLFLLLTPAVTVVYYELWEHGRSLA